MENLISIIVPVYNVEKYLDRCINSLVEQTYKKIEIILVNDGSKDRSGFICDDWEKKDSRIMCIHQENKGVSSARNVGFNQSTGDYILFIDGDDEIARDMCEKMLNQLLEDNADVCYCGFLNIFQDRTEKIVPKSKVLIESEILHELVTEGTFFTAIWNKLFRRSILQNKQAGFIEFTQGIYLGEDALWLSKVLKNARKVVALPEALYYWKRRENSATQGGSTIRTDEKYLSVLEAYKKMVNELCDHPSRNIIFKRYLGITRDCMIQAYKENKKGLSDELTKRICTDKKMYEKIDLFLVKLNVCVWLVKIGAPLTIINVIQKL